MEDRQERMENIPKKDIYNIEKAQNRLHQANKKLAEDLHKYHPNSKQIKKDSEQIIRYAQDCEKLIRQCCKKCG